MSEPHAPLLSSKRVRGYMIIMLLVVLTVMAIGLGVAVPVWRTQVQREKEEELLFRGRQYVEAVRLYQAQHPGRFPQTLKELYDEKCLRKLFKDPVSPSGEWNVILLSGAAGQVGEGGAEQIIVAPQSALESLSRPSLIGVVSASTKKSIKVYNEGTSYDQWLFYYGQDPKQKPKIVYYGRESDEDE